MIKVTEQQWMEARLECDTHCDGYDRQNGDPCFRMPGHDGFCWSREWYMEHREKIDWSRSNGS